MSENASIEIDAAKAQNLGWQVVYGCEQPNGTYVLRVRGGQRGDHPAAFRIIYTRSPATGAWTFQHAEEVSWRIEKIRTRKSLHEYLWLWAPRPAF